MAKITDAQIAAVVRAAGFPENSVAVMVAVALAESGGVTDIVGGPNSNGTYDYGLFQINQIHKSTFLTSWPLWYQPLANANMAYRIYKDAGGSYSPWSTFNSGAYRTYLLRGTQAQGSGEAVANDPDKTPTASIWNKGEYNLTPTIKATDSVWKELTVNGKVRPGLVSMLEEPKKMNPLKRNYLDGSKITSYLTSDGQIYGADHVTKDGANISSITWDNDLAIKAYKNGAITFQDGVDVIVDTPGAVAGDLLGGLLPALKTTAYIIVGILLIILSIIMVTKQKGSK